MKYPIGTRFNRLVIAAEAGYREGKRFVQCACDCGARHTVSVSRLVSGHTKSCGCYKRELIAQARGAA